MANRLSKFKPGVSRKTLLLLSALFWSVIGVLLLYKGGKKIITLGEGYGMQVFILIVSLGTGSIKSYFILDRSAKRAMNRILQFKDGTCLGAVYSFKTWILVFSMMGLGIFLRNSSISVTLLCFIYITIGWSLLFSSRFAWKVWYKSG